MSHFAVLVIGDDIEGQLAPYNEQDDNYSVFKDVSAEYLPKYENDSAEFVVFPDGKYASKYNYRKHDFNTGNDTYAIPSGAELKEVRFNVVYQTFEEYMKEWCGYEKNENGQFGYMTNPNGHWDWWVVGGRWSGFFKVKDNPQGICELGEPGTFDNKAPVGHADSLRVGDIDFEGMRFDARREANKKYDNLEKILNGRPIPSWNDVREKHGENINAARQEYHSMETVKELNKHDDFRWIIGDLAETFGPDRKSYVRRCENRVCSTYAVVHEGEWIAKGKMGWFGMSNDKVSEDEWDEKVINLLTSLPPDTRVTLVDCHV